jgi:integrase/recombinase XerD
MGRQQTEEYLLPNSNITAKSVNSKVPGKFIFMRGSYGGFANTFLCNRSTIVSMIQKLLGHNDIKTTLRYLHTSNKDLLKIVSPLDDLHLT